MKNCPQCNKECIPYKAVIQNAITNKLIQCPSCSRHLLLASPGILSDLVGSIFFQFAFLFGIVAGLYTQSWIVFGVLILFAMFLLLLISTLWPLKKAVNL